MKQGDSKGDLKDLYLSLVQITQRSFPWAVFMLFTLGKSASTASAKLNLLRDDVEVRGSYSVVVHGA